MRTRAVSSSTRPTPPGSISLFEAAVAGGVPLIRPLKESLAGDRVAPPARDRERHDQLHPHADVRARLGLRRGARGGAAAGLRGGRSRPPTSRGADAAAKCAILASIAFNTRVVASDVYREGIAGVTAQDIADADAARLRREAARDRRARRRRDLRAGPPGDDPGRRTRSRACATPSTRCSSRPRRVGQLMFYGRGAGGDPSATSVVGDVVLAARHAAFGGRAIGCTCGARSPDPGDGRHAPASTTSTSTWRTAPASSPRSRRCSASIGVSIERVWQEGFGEEADARVRDAPRARGRLPGHARARCGRCRSSARSRACCASRARRGERPSPGAG